MIQDSYSDSVRYISAVLQEIRSHPTCSRRGVFLTCFNLHVQNLGSDLNHGGTEERKKRRNNGGKGEAEEKGEDWSSTVSLTADALNGHFNFHPNVLSEAATAAVNFAARTRGQDCL